MSICDKSCCEAQNIACHLSSGSRLVTMPSVYVAVETLKEE